MPKSNGVHCVRVCLPVEMCVTLQIPEGSDVRNEVNRLMTRLEGQLGNGFSLDKRCENEITFFAATIDPCDGYQLDDIGIQDQLLPDSDDF